MICVASLGKCCNTCKIKGNLQNKIPPNVLQNRILFSLLSFIIPVSLSSSFNPTHPDISPFLQIISKYTLLQTLPDLITILSCMSLLFLFPSSSLSHCLSPSSDYLLSLSLSLPRTLSGSQILKIEIWRMVLLEASIQGYHSQSNEDTPLARGGRRAPCPHSSICECEWVLHFVYLCSRVLSRQ